MTLAKLFSHGNLRRWHFCAQLVCLWIDIDHSKFEPHRVSHRGAACETSSSSQSLSFTNSISLVM